MDNMLFFRIEGRPGFTLLELLFLLSLAALLATLIAPSLRSYGRQGETTAAAREMLAVMQAAHWKAVLSGRRVRLAQYTRRGDRALWYVMEREEGGVWLPVGEGHRIPERVRMSTKGSPVKVFNPNGTCSMGSVSLTGPGGKSCRLALNPLTGRVRLYRGDREDGSEG